MRLGNMVAVVTGGGTGIGRAVAELFAREGARLVVAGRRREPLDDTVLAIEKDGGQALAVTADVTAADDVRGPGRGGRRPVRRGRHPGQQFGCRALPDDGRAVLRRALDGHARRQPRRRLPAREVPASRIDPDGGCIVHIASVFAFVGMANTAAYTAAKGGLVSLTRAMAVNFGPQGVRVNAVCPAYVETDMNREMLNGLRAEKKFDAVLDRLPLGFLGEPSDVAYAALYLASSEARWVTGVALAVDGGMSAGRL